ncbi:hypothetical protein F5Y16DRAFT_397790 [Xylariaceae sp. FL0255]|nr:hypothetical protein F5Y16DRAFT_397790 [Xylariaceae sp. FL0255]
MSSTLERRKDYGDEIRSLADGGADAVAVNSDTEAANDSAIPLTALRSMLMAVGLHVNPLRFDAMELVRGTYRVKGDSTSTPQRLGKVADFTDKHKLTLEIESYTSCSMSMAW